MQWTREVQWTRDSTSGEGTPSAWNGGAARAPKTRGLGIQLCARDKIWQLADTLVTGCPAGCTILALLAGVPRKLAAPRIGSTVQ